MQQSQSDDSSGLIARKFKNARGETIPYRIFIPQHYDPRKKYPLVVWLHGGGGRGTDNLKQILKATRAGFTSGQSRTIRRNTHFSYSLLNVLKVICGRA